MPNVLFNISRFNYKQAIDIWGFTVILAHLFWRFVNCFAFYNAYDTALIRYLNTEQSWKFCDSKVLSFFFLDRHMGIVAFYCILRVLAIENRRYRDRNAIITIARTDALIIKISRDTLCMALQKFKFKKILHYASHGPLLCKSSNLWVSVHCAIDLSRRRIAASICLRIAWANDRLL